MLGGIGKMRPCGHHHYYKYAHAKNRDDLLAVHGNITNYTDDLYDDCWGPFSLENLTSMHAGFSEASVFGNSKMRKWHGYVPNVTNVACAFYQYGDVNRPQSSIPVTSTSSNLEESILEGLDGNKVTTGWYSLRGTKCPKIPDWIKTLNPNGSNNYMGVFMACSNFLKNEETDEWGIKIFPYFENLDNYSSNLYAFALWVNEGHAGKSFPWKLDNRYSLKYVASMDRFSSYYGRFTELPKNLSLKNCTNINGMLFDGTDGSYFKIFETVDTMEKLVIASNPFSVGSLNYLYPSYESFSFPKLSDATNMFIDAQLDDTSVIKLSEALPTWTDGKTKHLITIGIHKDYQFDKNVNLALKKIDADYVSNVELDEEITSDKGWQLTVQFNESLSLISPVFSKQLIIDENLLPEGYKRVEYLKDNGNQFINTNYIPTINTGLWIIAIQDNYNDSMAFGVRENSNYFYCPCSRRNYPYYYGWKDDVQMSPKDDRSSYHYQSSLNWLNDKKAILNITNTISYNFDLTNFEESFNYPIYLFGRNASGTVERKYGGRIYRAKISEGTEIIHDYIPCLDANGKPCLYDILGTGTTEENTYYNLGTGADFTYKKWVFPNVLKNPKLNNSENE